MTTIFIRRPSAGPWLSLALALAACDSGRTSLSDASLDATDTTSCSDTDTNAQHCGRCGHDCQGGTCVAGACLPVKLDDAQRCALALDATNVYWSGGDTTDAVHIMMRAHAGGAAAVLADAAGEITDIAVDLASLYWSQSTPDGPGVNHDAGVVSKVSLSGGPAVTLATVPLRPSSIAVHQDDVYFTTWWIANFDPSDQLRRGELLRVPTAGGASVAVATELEQAGSLVVDVSNVYWAQWFGPTCTWGCVMSMPFDGQAPLAIFSNGMTTQRDIPAIALDGRDVYWTNAGLASTVMGQPLTGGQPVTIADALDEPRAIALDATAVYFTTSAGAVLRTPRQGGATTTLSVDPLAKACAIAVNDTSVYWIAGNALMRLAK